MLARDKDKNMNADTKESGINLRYQKQQKQHQRKQTPVITVIQLLQLYLEKESTIIIYLIKPPTSTSQITAHPIGRKS